MLSFFKTKTKQEHLPDAAIIENFKKDNDAKYIGFLYERYAGLVYAVCLKYLKEESESKDAVNAIFEKLFVDLKRFEIRQFSSWIHRVACNHCLTELKKNKLLLHNAGEYDQFIQAEPGEEEEWNYKIIDDAALYSALEELEDNQRICIELFYFKNHSYQKIVHDTNLSLLQVKSCIQNGKRNLKINLTKDHAKQQ